MTNSISSDLPDEAAPTASPQLRDRTSDGVDVGAWWERPDVIKSLAVLAAAPAAQEANAFALIKALSDQLEAAEARTAEARRQLAAHYRHCICRADDIAAEDTEPLNGTKAASETAAPDRAASSGDGVFTLAT